MHAIVFAASVIQHHAVQAGAITGFVSAFAEGPIDFFKSQIQVQIIRSKSDPNYKRATPLSACWTICNQHSAH